MNEASTNAAAAAQTPATCRQLGTSEEDRRDSLLLTLGATNDQIRPTEPVWTPALYMSLGQKDGCPFLVCSLKTIHRLVINYCAPESYSNFMPWLNIQEKELRNFGTEGLLVSLPLELALFVTGSMLAAGYTAADRTTFKKQLNTPADQPERVALDADYRPIGAAQHVQQRTQ